MLSNATIRSAAVVARRHRFDDQQNDGDNMGQQGATGERNDVVSP